MSQPPINRKLVVATRLHLGNAASPPDQAKTERQVAGFADFVATSCPPSTIAVIAVDATPKVEGYDYVAAVQQACEKVSSTAQRPHVLPVTPWGKFVSALNALIVYAIQNCQADWILFVSAETKASTATINTLCHHVSAEDTLVAGALLGGHDYQHHPTSGDASSSIVALTGRTTPWNTMAVWKLSKLAITGFQLVSDGLLTDDATEPSYGVEEVVAIALLQKILGEEQAKAKLIKLPDVEWNQVFEDEERRQWHEKKMKSKLERAGRQLELMKLTGKVHHCC